MLLCLTKIEEERMLFYIHRCLGSSLQWNTVGVTVAGNGTSGNGSSQLSQPWSIYMDSNSTLYVTDYNNHRIQQWLPNAVSGNTVAGVTGVSGSNGSYLSFPLSVYGDSQQNLYIGDNNAIYKWPLGSSIGTRLPSSSGLGNIFDIFVDSTGNIYASIFSRCVVMMWPVTGTNVTTVAGGSSCGYSSAQLANPYGVTVDSTTNTIYIGNYWGHTIVTWIPNATTGTIIAGWNSTTGTTNFLLNHPRGLRRDQYGNLYVADANNYRVLLFCQNPPSTNAVIISGYETFFPYSIAFDSNLNLYVGDGSTHRVLKFTRIV